VWKKEAPLSITARSHPDTPTLGTNSQISFQLLYKKKSGSDDANLYIFNKKKTKKTLFLCKMCA